MNEWLVAVVVLLGGLAVCGVVCALAKPVHGLVALELGGALATAVLLLLAEGLERQSFADLAVVFAFLAFAGTLTFVRLMERRL